MHAAIITPRNHMGNFSHLTRFDMVVPDHFTGAQARERKDFVIGLAQRGHYIILDNGVYERGVALSGNELMALAREIEASEIVVPDYFKERNLTHHAVFGFLEEHWEEIHRLNLNIMIVPQGKDTPDWIKALTELQYAMSNVHVEFGILPRQITWGIPKWISEERNRIDLVHALPNENQYRKASPYKYHLLGLSKIQELLHFEYLPDYLRSLDTSLPVRAAVHGRGLFDKNPVEPGTIYMNATMESGQFTEACYNVVQMLSVVPEFTQYRKPV